MPKQTWFGPGFRTIQRRLVSAGYKELLQQQTGCMEEPVFFPGHGNIAWRIGSPLECAGAVNAVQRAIFMK
jgi:hypothetical protein